jgi:hypothetical protein
VDGASVIVAAGNGEHVTNVFVAATTMCRGAVEILATRISSNVIGAYHKVTQMTTQEVTPIDKGIPKTKVLEEDLAGIPKIMVTTHK